MSAAFDAALGGPAMMLRLASLLLALLVAAPAPSPTAQEPPEPETADAAGSDLDDLVSWMSGSFSSAAQAEEDADFLDLRFHIVPIWTDRDDGRWLYVEQTTAAEPLRPYRQRVYRVTQVAEDLFESRVYSAREPLRFAGAWRQEAPLAGLSPDDLSLRDGCSILMRRRGDRFIGGTLGSLCTSRLRGASRATSEVVITPHGFISWDRGWSPAGDQVWGAVTGGYIFDRIVEAPDAEESPSDAEPNPEPEPVPEQGRSEE